MKEILVIHVKIDSSHTVKGHKGEGQMILFHGSADGPYFSGVILPGGVDTQKQPANGPRTLSARYILEGTDCEGSKCRIFIENNATLEYGQEMITHPIIYTDSQALKWMEDIKCTGHLVGDREGCTITFVEEEA